MAPSLERVAILLVLGTICAIVSSVFTWQQIDQVNRKLAQDKQFSFLGWYYTTLRNLSSEYTRLYPSGKLNILIRIFVCAALLFWILSAVSMGFFK